MSGDWLIWTGSSRAFFGAALLLIVLVMALVDYRKLILPNRLNAIFAAMGLGQAVLIGRLGMVDAVLGAAFAFVFMWTVAELFRRYRGIDGLGFGDVKFSAAAGLWLGWEDIAPMLLVASCSALLFVVLRSWNPRRYEPAMRLPFGPFLGFSTVVCWLLAAPPQSLT